MGRLDDISIDSEAVVAEIVEALGPDRDAQVLAASIRHPVHVVTAARLGCEVATIPDKVFKADARPPADRGGDRAASPTTGRAGPSSATGCAGSSRRAPPPAEELARGAR